jgi:glutathione S-transferase
VSRPTLYIGDKRYSSWSMRPWLALKHAGIDFEEVVVPLDTPEFVQRIGGISPTRTVPALHLDGLVVWDSLAISEWAAEQAPLLWPADPGLRATARAMAATMHSGFSALRREAPMNLGRRDKPKPLSEAALKDVARIEALWRDYRTGDGPFLFSAWSIADAFWTPVATRIRSYAIPVGAAAQAYVDVLLREPHFQDWLDGALAETRPHPLRDET